AQLLGSEPLKAEKARNYTFGAVWNPTENLSFSVDVYHITVRDRIALSSSLSLSTPEVIDYLADNGITNLQYQGLAYFTNAGTVKTKGIDLVASHRMPVGDDGSLSSTLSYGYHKNEVTDVRPNPPVLDSLGLIFQRLNRSAIKGLLADTAPRSKLILNETYTTGDWAFTGTLTRYGRVTSYGAVSSEDDAVYPGKGLLDLAASSSRDRWTFTLGSDNVLDTYPKRVPEDSDQDGAFPYSSSSPFGFQGAYV